MNRKNIWKKAGSAFIALVLAAGIGSAWRSETVMAANVSRTVTYGNAAVSTDGYTVKDDEYGNRKIWDGTNGQYVYLGGRKFHLLSRDNEVTLLRTAEVVKCVNSDNELTLADLWDTLDSLEQAQVLTVSLPEETFTANNTVYTAPALQQVKTYQLSLNDVFRYYGGLTDHYNGYTRSDCHINKYNIAKENPWVNFSIYGALKLDLSSVAFTTAAGVEKPDTFSTTGWVRDNKSNRLTFSDETDFQATMISTQAVENGAVQVKVDNLPAVHSYTQISAMALDANGSVAAYGKIGAAQAGTYSFTLPDSMNAGSYTLKIFAEAVSENTNASDHISKMAEFTLTVTEGTQNTVSVINLNDTNLHLTENSGTEKQEVKSDQAITPIVYTVDSYLEPSLTNPTNTQCGYYIPDGYESEDSLEGTGLQITVDQARKTVTISGTPTRNIELVLPAAEAQRSRGNVSKLLYLLGDGKLGGTTEDMVWYTDIGSPKDCTAGMTETNITDQTVTVCYKPTIQYPVMGKASFSLNHCHKITTKYDGQYGTVKVTVNGYETSYAEYNNGSGTQRFPKLEIDPKQGYQCGKVEIINCDTNQPINWKENGTFWMPDADVEISIAFEPKTYVVTVAEAAGGTASASHTAAAKDTEITLTANPQEDYQLAGWQVVRTDGTESIAVQDHKFTMPEGDVTVTPIFELKQTSIAQAEEAIRLIDVIGQVVFTEECASRITQARTAYDALSAVQKTLIPDKKLTLLTNAEAVFAELKEQTEADQAAAKVVEDKINAIGTVAYTERCKTAIGEARAAYEELEEAQKRWLADETVMTLTIAERTYLELKKQSENQLTDQGAADTAVKMFYLIGDVTYTDTSKAAINAARAVYDRLTAEQKALISADQLAILTKAEATYAAYQKQAEDQKAAEEAAKRAEEEKKAAEEAAKRDEEKKAADQTAADTAVAAIHAIGTVSYTDKSKALIEAARAAYDTLTVDQKTLIPADKVTILTNAETQYAALTAAALAPKLEQTKAAQNSVAISWKADQKATAGYRIYIKGGSFKKFTKVADTKKGVTSYTIKKANNKKLAAGTQYELKIVSLKKSGKKTAELSAQKLKAVTVTAAPKFTSAARSKNGKNITLKWKKVSGASGYEIQMSTKAKSGFKKLTTAKAKATSYTRKSLSKSKTYYFRMRTYKTINGKKFYSSWSAVKKVNKK